MYVKLRPYRQVSSAKRMNEKLSPRFYGPFAVLQKIGTVAYKLDLPPTSCIHPVFHISLLKKCAGTANVAERIPKNLTDAMELIVEPKSIRGTRSTSEPEEKRPDVLIRWKDLPPFEDSWERYSVIQEQFPSFNLEDKVALLAVGTNKPKTIRTYARRGTKRVKDISAKNDVEKRTVGAGQVA